MEREITITLDDQTAEALERRAAERGGSLREVVEELIRDEVAPATKAVDAAAGGEPPRTTQHGDDPNAAARTDTLPTPEEEANMSRSESFALIRRLSKHLIVDPTKTDQELIEEYLDQKYG